LFRVVLIALVLAFASCPTRADDEGVLIVQLSILATVGKCAQAQIEFKPAEWTALSNHIWQSPVAQQLPREDRVHLWMVSRSMFSKIDSKSCARVREQIKTWFPNVAL
jgi:hypothetical protein